jgi:hypothetical protein
MDQQTPCHPEKSSKTAVFHDPNGSALPAIDAAAAEFSAPFSGDAGRICPDAWRVLGESRPHASKKCPEHDPEKWVPVFRKDHAQTKDRARWRAISL